VLSSSGGNVGGKNATSSVLGTDSYNGLVLSYYIFKALSDLTSSGAI